MNYNDNWSYQENLLPKTHVRQGHNVTVITTCRILSDSEKIIKTEPRRYTLDSGVKMIRLAHSKKYFIEKIKRIFVSFDLYPLLCELKPDLIMVHGVDVGITYRDIVKYVKKNKETCTLIGDSHLFDEIAPEQTTLRGKIISAMRIRWRKKLINVCETVFCITPACIDYAKKMYSISDDKIQLLPLGYDSELIDWNNRLGIKKEWRREHGLSDDDIVIIHGGKIIKRRLTPLAINAVKALNRKDVKLVIFGEISDDMKSEVEQLIKENEEFVKYLGLLSLEEYNKAYIASDIALFPGGQSVLWQEAIGCGLPLIVGSANNIEYLDRGGNIVFAERGSLEDLIKKLKGALENDNYKKMSEIAATKGREYFSYERMAKTVTDVRKE